MPIDNRTKMERHLKSDKKQVFYRIERDGIKKRLTMVQRESLFLISIKGDFKSKNLKMRKQVLILNLNQKLIANLVKRVFLTDLLLNLHVHLV